MTIYPSDGWWSWPFTGGHGIVVEIREGFIVGAVAYYLFEHCVMVEWRADE